MKPVAVFLSGLTATVTGAFIRSCSPAIPVELSSSWCGVSSPLHLTAAAHAHCVGCVLAGAGLVVIAVSLLMKARPDGQSARPVVK